MDMIFAHPTLDNLNVVGIAALSDDFPYSKPDLLGQYFIAIFRDPNKMDSKIIDRMA